MPLHTDTIREALAHAAAIRSDQAGETDHAQFLASCWSAGVVGYTVDTGARTCTYRGARGERLVERYAVVEFGATR